MAFFGVRKVKKGPKKLFFGLIVLFDLYTVLPLTQTQIMILSGLNSDISVKRIYKKTFKAISIKN